MRQAGRAAAGLSQVPYFGLSRVGAIKGPRPRPFLKWAGGKRQLLPELLRAVDAAGSFRRYHEPLLGGGALFFTLTQSGRLRRASSHLSDVNRNLIDTYLGLRCEVDAVIKALKEHRRSHGEEYFYKVRSAKPRSLSRRAARIIYLNRTCYNGLYRENSKGIFNTPFGYYAAPVICDEENLRAVAETLADVDITTRDFGCVLDRARRGDLVYFDPPYDPVSKTSNFTAYSRDGFGADEQRRLADVAATLAGRGVKVVLSNSMTDFIRKLYRDFHLREVFATRYVNSRADRRGKVPEALITSFPVESKDDAPASARGGPKPPR